MWEFKVDNNANIANFACLWKTRLYVVFFTVMAICQKDDLNNESGLDLDELSRVQLHCSNLDPIVNTWP